MAVKKILASNSLADVMDRILDKGVVVDSWARVSLLGVELRAMETRLAELGENDYLRYADAIGHTAKAQETYPPT